ncbi:MAG: response regulator [Defluviitaleaceae bacterium]|nr:response regulator [Defluviitaleaceae bacterium]MCL2240455.1 response regulator [Defluviitaleaceae bacterium]
MDKEKLLNTIKEAAEVLLTADEHDTLNALSKGMEIVGRCVDADRVQIWRNETIDGEQHFVMRYEWLSETGKTKKVVPLGLKFPHKNKGKWLKLFSQGKNINATVSSLHPEDRIFLGYYGMISIACIPLYLNKKLIGFFSVDDCRNECVYSEDEMKMLASTGLMFASVFNRVQQAEAIKRREGLLHAMNRATRFLLNATASTFDVALYEAMRVIAHAVEVNRVFVFKNLVTDNKRSCTKIYGWSDGIESQPGKISTTHVPYEAFLHADWLKKLSSKECVLGIVSELPPEISSFIPEDVKSIIIVPIFKGDNFWGIIGFDDCKNERYFTGDEEEILRSCGLLLVNAMNRNIMTDEETRAMDTSYIGRRILLVEDVELNRDIVLALLADSGIIIDTAENGQEAVDMVLKKKRKYDLIFMDLNMPVMSGYEATLHIREKCSRKQLPIVALTASTLKEEIQDCINAGMNDHLSKPMDVNEFFTMLQKYMA